MTPLLHYVHGDLLEAIEPVIAHGCNAQGVMGSGVAKAIRDRWPSAYRAYERSFQIVHNSNPDEFLGTFSATRVGGVMSAKIIANVVTQLDYGRTPGVRYVSYDALDRGFRNLALDLGVADRHIAIPMVGAGLAQGDWRVIEAILSRIEDDLGCKFHVYIPDPMEFQKWT